MRELFHTEDCGISLICRCCRGPVCAQQLTKADRLRVERDLWAPDHPWPARRAPKQLFSWVSGLFVHMTRLL